MDRGMIALRVSHLDRFIKHGFPQEWIGPSSDWEFLQSLMVDREPGRAAKLGSAYHSLMDAMCRRDFIEHRDVDLGFKNGRQAHAYFPGDFIDGKAVGFDLPFERPAIPDDAESEVELNPMLFEESGVILHGRSDLIAGDWCWDWKTTSSAIDEDRYRSSLQGPAYMMMSNRSAFRYSVVRFTRPRGYKGAGLYRVSEPVSVDVHMSEEAERFVRRTVSELASFIRAYGESGNFSGRTGGGITPHRKGN